MVSVQRDGCMPWYIIKDDMTRRLSYYETHEHEYVYEETKNGTTIVLGFYKIENGQVIDEHTTAWH